MPLLIIIIILDQVRVIHHQWISKNTIMMITIMNTKMGILINSVKKVQNIILMFLEHMIMLHIVMSRPFNR